MSDSTGKQPILILVRGMPGSGKSYLAAELQRVIGPDLVAMLDPDTIDSESQDYIEFTNTPFAREVGPNIHPFRYLKSQAYAGITEGKAIIWNQPFTDRGMFDRLVANLQAYAAERDITLPALLVEVDIDPATAKERVQRRKREGGHGPSETTLDLRISDYESFAGNGYQTVSVDGAGDVAASVSTVRDAMHQLLS